MIKRLQNILSSTEPENKEVLWLHIFNGKVVQKLYLNGGWTSISSQGGGGGGDVDLSDYYTKPQVDSKFALKSSLSAYVTTKTAESFATKSDISNLENIYAKSNTVEGILKEVENIQNDYVTSSDISNFIDSDALKGYTYSKEQTDKKYATISSLDGLGQLLDERISSIEEDYVKNSQIAGFVDSQTVDQLIYDATKDLPTKSYVQTIADNSVDQAVQGLATEDYVTQQIEATLGTINAQLEEV